MSAELREDPATPTNTCHGQDLATDRSGGRINGNNGQDRLMTHQSVAIQPALLGVSAAAAYCGISRALFYSLAADGTIGPLPVRFSSRVLYSRKVLDQWIDAGCPPRTKWLAIRQGGGMTEKEFRQLNQRLRQRQAALRSSRDRSEPVHIKNLLPGVMDRIRRRMGRQRGAGK